VDIYASDEEKGEEIKRWWRENGLAVMLGIALGIAGLVGGRYWLNQQAMSTTQASSLYQQASVYLAEGNGSQAVDSVDKLFSDFANTPYATFAAFDMAKNSLANEDTNGAKAYLEWVIGHAKLTGQKEIAKLRLSKLQLDESNFEQALMTLNLGETTAFKSLFDELKGDVYLAQGKKVEAALAYQAAKITLDENDPRGLILKLKLDDIAGS
jgi:predicted negative regulator of RcsB-dependent stress response